MRTTVELPDVAFRGLKVLAAREGVTLKQILLRAVDAELRRAGQGLSEERREFPVVRSKRPGSLRITNAEIDDLLAGR